jgi:hypothetical protein
MSESFLSRWSRRKRANSSPRLREDVDAPKQSEGTSREGAPPPAEAVERIPHPDPLPASGKRDIARAEREPPDFDPASLPPIESIDASTDVSAFLRPGVPPELAKAALRRARIADPAIRDFVGPAENSWDFTAPGGVPGFGPLRAIDDVQRLAAQVMGALPDAAPNAAAAEETKDAAEASKGTIQSAQSAAQSEPTGLSIDDAATQKDASKQGS